MKSGLGAFVLACLVTKTLGACHFFQKSCLISEKGPVYCYLEGKSGDESLHPSPPTEPSLDEVLAQVWVTPGNEGCPVLSSYNVPFVIYLEPCVDNIIREENLNATQKIDKINQGCWQTPSGCTKYQTHTITTALLDDDNTRHFPRGIQLLSAAYPRSGRFQCAKASIPRAHIVRGKSFEDDQTCNVVNNGMPDVHLKYLTLNNSACVEDAVGDDLDGALEKFGPDQLELIRVTKIFSDFDPTGFRAEYLLLSTYSPYRTKYPGRALISFDALKSTKYPPDSINLGSVHLNYIEDYHLRDSYSTDIAINGTCPTLGYALEPDGVTCINAKYNSIASRPIDMILWDFQGDVYFGSDWPSQAGVIFTVLVFADREKSSTTKLIEGEVFEDYIDTKNENKGVFLPDPSIMLLDASDFYDVAQDEFDCFSKPAPECPKADLTVETLIVLAVLSLLTYLHHRHDVKKKKKLIAKKAV